MTPTRTLAATGSVWGESEKRDDREKNTKKLDWFLGGKVNFLKNLLYLSRNINITL
jgi:hypothetical protein